MVVLKPPAIAIPVSGKKAAAFVVRANPYGAGVGSTSPVSLVPFIASAHRIPVAVDPGEIGPWCRWPDCYHPGWRRRTDSNSNCNLTESSDSGQKKQRKKFVFHAECGSTIIARVT